MRKALLLSVLLLLAACQSTDTSQETSKVCFDSDCFGVEVVDTPETRAEGLMYRGFMEEDKGMLFIFENSGRYPFWMKNTFINLDMIWMDENKEVVYIEHNATPCETDPCPNYDPEANALYVLEVNAGIADDIDLEVGEKAEFKLVN